MLAVPIVDQLPSIVAVLACTIASRKRKIRTPESSSWPKYPRESQSATMWFDFAGQDAARRPRAGRGAERVDEVLVRDEVGVGQPDVAGGPVDRLEVHRPDREHPAAGARCGAAGSGAPTATRSRAAAAARWPECLRRCRFQKSANARLRSQTPGPVIRHVRVAPLGGVGAADVVAADEADLVVDDEDLAVVAAVAAQVEEPQPGACRPGSAAPCTVGGKRLNARADHEVREPVVDRRRRRPRGRRRRSAPP